MITNKELNNVVLSPTKKDYYQIWAELLDLASKISDRWTPDATNESDPGIVLLKALTAIADKINYNIDKNTLEAFMPSATQEESMRKLTEMMGYSMKYYQSATCKVRIEFKEQESLSWNDFPTGIYFPKFVNLTNEDEDINYVTLESFKIYKNEPYRTVYAIEGELVTCESDSDNVISLRQLDDNNRYFLPEIGIAENGIFISNISDNIEEELWEKVENLNINFAGSRVFKFGIDSTSKLPYVQFPEDISHLIKRGLKIQYIRTSGINGNKSAGNLSKLTIPAEWTNIVAEDDPIKKLSEENFKVKQLTSALNGSDPESLNDAYNNYKKTIGTFETLVTCRDYMNKIYQLTVNENSATPLVSNIIVSDIRDDINNAITLCSFNDYGISYSNKSLQDAEGNDKIDHCDLILYPFKTIYGVNDEREYNNSFKYDASNNTLIEKEISEVKTISHKLKSPSHDDITCIKNYLQLKAQVYTHKKVTSEEGREILKNIRTRLFDKFNARHIDFGEEIPYNLLVDEIINADSRIKDINLDDPILVTKICTKDNSEYLLASMEDSNSDEAILTKQLYNKLVLRNILAGRIAAFSYDNSFAHDYRDTKYSSEYAIEYGPDDSKYISKLVSNFKVSQSLYTEKDDGIKLKDNQVIQFRMPNLRTAITYPAYVNYYFNLNNQLSQEQPYYPATMQTILKFIQTDTSEKFYRLMIDNSSNLVKILLTINAEEATKRKEIYNSWIASKRLEYGEILVADVHGEHGYSKATSVESIENGTYEFYVLPLDGSTLGIWDNWVTGNKNKEYDLRLSGIYKNNGVDLNSVPGELRDNLRQGYTKITTISTQHNSTTLQNFYLPVLHDRDVEGQYTADGLGRNGKNSHIAVNSDYQLQENEYLLINYTDSSTDENNVETKTVINKYYGQGTIIRPNFELTNSRTYNTAGHSWSKKDGFKFTEVSNPDGMFTLGTNEQIEIREIAKIKLDGIINLYWMLNSDDPNAYTQEFKFEEVYSDNEISAPESGKNAYTLKEGEYLFYTDQNKTDFAYYGAGSIIVKSGISQLKRSSSGSDKVSIEAVEQNWVETDIPWNTFALTSDDKAIFVIENQYLSLTSGDVLNFASKDIIETRSENHVLSLSKDLDSTEWVPVASAKYTLAEGGSKNLPVINIPGLSWKVKSRLDFNMSSGNPQTLNEGDEIEVFYTNASTGRLENQTVVLKPTKDSEDKIIPLTIQPNSLCLGAVSEIDVTQSSAIVDGELTDVINKDFKIKITKRNEIVTKDGSTLSLNNYTNNDWLFTKYTFIGEPNIDDSDENKQMKFSISESNRYLIKIINFGTSDEGVFIGKKDETSGELKYTGKILYSDQVVNDQTIDLPEENKNIKIQSPYYLFGNFNNWANNELFRFKAIDANNLFIELSLVANDEFIIAKKNLKNSLNLLDRLEENLPEETLDNLKEDFGGFGSFNVATKDFDLFTSLLDDTFGLVMFYWIFDDKVYSTADEANKIKAQAKIVAYGSSSRVDGLQKINSETEISEQSYINLQRGFNMVKISPDVQRLEIYGTCGNIIFDNLRIVKDINPLLDYQLWKEPECETELDQLMFDIKNYGEVARDFYYSAPLLASTAIEINPLVSTDTLLKNPLTWYDNNNTNNKFVISEIDTDYLKTGITIARTSRV